MLPYIALWINTLQGANKLSMATEVRRSHQEQKKEESYITFGQKVVLHFITNSEDHGHNQGQGQRPRG
jgi:hypothetical protein